MAHDFGENPQPQPMPKDPMNAPRQPPWLETQLGSVVAELEARVCADALADVFGFQLLQIGGWGGQGELVEQARTQHRCVLAPDATGPGAVRSHFDALPIASASVEAVLLPHTLEHAAHPHGLLREVERVLVGEGTVLICGFNPLGPWGVRHVASGRRFPPTAHRLLSEGRVRDWLGLLGFEVTLARRFLFAPPWTQRLSERAREFLESRGPVIAPPLAGAYLLKARKRVRGLTPIRPLWQRGPVVVGSVAEPTSRNAA
jgi:SAM-dependent methyltransferase